MKYKSNTDKGLAFEGLIYDFLKEELDKGNLNYAASDSSEIDKQFPVPTTDNLGETKIDVLIRVFNKLNRDKIDLYIPVECKHKKNVVPSDVRTFSSLINSINGICKPIFACTSKPSDNVLKIIQSNNIALIQVDQQLENTPVWEVHEHQESYGNVDTDLKKVFIEKKSSKLGCTVRLYNWTLFGDDLSSI